jgi:hypothetical protein
MTLIHKNYAFPRNIHKIATSNKISPYLQIINIQNKPLNPNKPIHAHSPRRLTINTNN